MFSATSWAARSRARGGVREFCEIEFMEGIPAKRLCLADTATVNRINTTTILTGLENLPIREKALWKAEELLVRPPLH